MRQPLRSLPSRGPDGGAAGTAKMHANVALWNTIRFNPLYALLEMLLGVALGGSAARWSA